MSPQLSDPARTHALLVGIEVYQAGDDWKLDGPARDVMDMHAWLTAHGVPAGQIKVLASSLPHNVTLMDEQNIEYKAATSNRVRQTLDELQKANGDLLIIFWAGHAAFNDRQHRLFLFDSTVGNKKNIEWETLRSALASTYFGGFARQIVIVDACADIRRDWVFSAVGEPIPAGSTVARPQFVLFATRIGETAANLDSERRGLFTRELLRQFNSDAHRDAWPPDMVEIARAVRTALNEQTGGTQIPRFVSSDWDGNEETFSADAAGSGAQYPSVNTKDRVALVIGISQYKDGVQAGHPDPRPWQFRNLDFASADAGAVYDFLQERTDYEVLEPLLDEKATLSGILRALDGLRRRCRQGNKTAVVYFSGHGATDGEGRSYLAPHDARRNDLFATALWNKTFANVLDEFKDNRLVLLVDACHAGAMSLPGDKGSSEEGFDPNTLTGGTAAAQRFILSSCQPQQRSYERDGHGIFTHHLLALLRGEGPGVIPAEEIELYDLYKALGPLVSSTALEKHNVVQEPFASFKGRTGVVLAINERLRRERVERPIRYLNALLECLARLQYGQQRKLEARLRNHVERGERQESLKAFYEYFAEGLRETNPDNTDAIERDCRDLIDYYERAAIEALPPQRQGNRRPDPIPDRSAAATAQPLVDQLQAARLSLDPAGTAAARTLLYGTQPPGLGTAGAADTARSVRDAGTGEVEDRRVLQEADVSYILENVLSIPALYLSLSDVLSQDLGVTSNEVTVALAKASKKARPDNWIAMRDGITERFNDRFGTAKRVVHTNTLSLRVGQGG